MGVAAYLAIDPILSELRTLRAGTDDVKVQLWGPALRVVRDFPLLGVGRGAFGTVFTSYENEPASVTFTHVENEWLQPVVDLGLPAGLLLVGTFVFLWLAAARRRDLSAPELGLLAGTAAVAAQNAFDFSLGLLGVGMPFAISMGLLARGERPLPVRPWLLRAGIAVAALVAAASLLVAHSRAGDSDLARVTEASGGDATADAARESLRWRPADWVPHAITGTRLAAEGRCGDALPWLLRAMALDPSAPDPHLSAARCLAGRNDAAAKREYRLAILLGRPAALAEAAERYPALEDLLEVAPATPGGLLQLGAHLSRARPADAAAVYRRALDEYGEEGALLLLSRTLVTLGDLESALALARRHSARRGAGTEGYLVAAGALVRLGREEEARDELARGLAAFPGSPPLLRFLVDRAMAAKRFSEAKRLSDEIAARTPADVAAKHLLAARALAGQGRLGEAIERARSAAAAQPDRADPLLTVAAYCEQAGRWDDAVAALRRAAALPGSAPDAHATRIRALEARRVEELERAVERRALYGVER